MTDEAAMTKLAIEIRLMKKIIAWKQRSFCYKNYTTNTYRKTFGQHISENQKKKVQHQEKQQGKLLETVWSTIKETDPSLKTNKNNADKNKEPRKKVMIHGQGHG